MRKELVIKSDGIVSKHDITEAGIGKVLMALGIGALCSDKLRKAAKYLVIAGVLVQVPVTLRIMRKATQYAKQVKKAKEEEQSTETVQEQPVQEDAAESELGAATEATANAEPVTENDVEPHSVPTVSELEHLNQTCEPASHPQEDPTN